MYICILFVVGKACTDYTYIYIIYVCVSLKVCLLVGKAYLWHQIRCIVSILFLVGEGREEPEVISELLGKRSEGRGNPRSSVN